MNIPYLLPTFLTLHLIALVVMAGTTLVDCLCYTSLWKHLDQKDRRPAALLNLMAQLPRFTRIGGATLILTGISMMYLTHGVFGEQLWFRIKFGLVILLILNVFIIGRRQGTKLRKILNEPGPLFSDQIKQVKINLNRFYMVQFILFAFIILLSVFKFN